jgi:hypothetical protein
MQKTSYNDMLPGAQSSESVEYFVTQKSGSSDEGDEALYDVGVITSADGETSETLARNMSYGAACKYAKTHAAGYNSGKDCSLDGDVFQLGSTASQNATVKAKPPRS